LQFLLRLVLLQIRLVCTLVQTLMDSIILSMEDYLNYMPINKLVLTSTALMILN
jgi:hypothetical protein